MLTVPVRTAPVIFADTFTRRSLRHPSPMQRRKRRSMARSTRPSTRSPASSSARSMQDRPRPGNQQTCGRDGITARRGRCGLRDGERLPCDCQRAGPLRSRRIRRRIEGHAAAAGTIRSARHREPIGVRTRRPPAAGGGRRDGHRTAAADSRNCLGRRIDAERDGASAWLTFTACPPIVTVAVRADPEFAPAATLTTPLPAPVAPAVICSSRHSIQRSRNNDLLVSRR